MRNFVLVVVCILLLIAAFMYMDANNGLDLQGMLNFFRSADSASPSNAPAQTAKPTPSPAREQDASTPAPTRRPAAVQKNIRLYFGHTDGEKLIPEKRMVSVAHRENLLKLIFEELAKGPKTAGASPTVPQGTRLLAEPTVKEGVCLLNLSEEFVKNNHSGTAGELMTIYSIVNSMTEIAGVRKVRFLINSKERESYLHMAIIDPIARDASMIRQ